MVHAFLAILAGLAIMIAITLAITAILKRFAAEFVGEGYPRPAYAVVNIAYSFVAAGVGGYVTACIAADNPLQNVLALGVVVLVLGAISTLQMRGEQPVWYQIAVLVLSTLGVFVGGVMRLRMTGML